MTNDFKKSDLPVEERIHQLLQHLGIERAHFAGQMQGDWIGLAASYPESITSLTLICPGDVDTSALGATATKLLVVNGDQGSSAESVRQEMTSLPDATVVNLKDTSNFPWADVVADRTDEVKTAVMDFLSRIDHEDIDDTPQLREGNGEFAGITYRISGCGPPIVLLPLGLASSQWEPIIAKLGESYCTITLGGAALGFVAVLEARGRTGYIRIVRDLMEEVELRPGESVLEVGCGTGVISRWLARRTGGKNKIVGLDISPYLLGEAIALTKNEGLGGLIEFREGNAEHLPLSDDSFDVTVSCTVLEEGDAERMLSEMIRVTKPGGRVAVIVRSVDMPCRVNVPVGAELKSKIEIPGGGVAEKGCADAGLSRRFHGSGLTKVKMFPQMAVIDAKGPYWHFLQNRLLANLTPEEVNEWQAALAQAESEKTFFFEMPHYWAVGTKPSQTVKT